MKKILLALIIAAVLIQPVQAQDLYTNPDIATTEPLSIRVTTKDLNKSMDYIEPVADLAVIASTYPIDHSWSTHYFLNKACVKLGKKIPVIKDHPIVLSVVVAGGWIVIKEVLIDSKFGVGDTVFNILGAASAFRF